MFRQYIRLLPLLLIFFGWTKEVLSLNEEGIYLLQFKSTLDDRFSSLSDWNPNHSSPCNWTGIHCSSSSSSVTSVNLFNFSIAGPFHQNLCRLSSLTYLDLSENYINSTLLPSSLLPCSSLTHLDLSDNLIVGELPSTLASLPSLIWLDLSGNNFTGDIPDSFGRFPRLEGLSIVMNYLTGPFPGFLGNISGLKELNVSYNPFQRGVLPMEIGNLSALERLWAADCNFVGGIPESVGNLRRLRYLDLSKNGLEGEIPTSITLLTSIREIDIYQNNLSGKIPTGLSKLTFLTDFDVSENQLVGTIPSDIFDLPLLEILNLNDNHLVGEVPAAISKVEKLRQIRLFENKLTGVIPADFGKKQPLVFVDLSQNQFTGEIPPGICEMGLLEDLMMIENKLSGPLPESLSGCNSITRLRLSTNFLSGEVPASVWGLPQVNYFDLAFNSFSGGISTDISRAMKITSLVINGNNFTGTIPEEIGDLSNLNTLSAGNNHFTGPLPISLGHIPTIEKLDLYDNNLSGTLLTSINRWKKLTELNLKKNRFTGPIPSQLGSLPVLNYLDLSDNNFSGEIPNQLENLKLNIFNFSNNDLSGTIPPFFPDDLLQNRFLGNPKLCLSPDNLCLPSKGDSSNNHSNLRVLLPIFLLSTAVLLVGIVWFYLRYQKFKNSEKPDPIVVSKSKSNSNLKLTFTSFHKLRFNEYEILDNLNEENIIGSGSSGNVYKVDISSGETVAVKMLLSKKSDDEDAHKKNRNFESEIATLGKIRHRCIVKLLCSCNYDTQDLLVYEYMVNGSLGDLLHSNKGRRILNWPMRYQIALDAAEGISYLHHDCVTPIIHRDIKSNNILLDAGFGAKIADFGVAKIFDVDAAVKRLKSMSVVTGSCGYIAPEYAYTLQVNEKSDVYSFGVVLLELATGKHPIMDPELEENDLVNWVITTLELKGIECVIDPKLDLSLQDDIGRVIDIGLLCTRSLPIARPSMRKVVRLLLEVGCNDNASKTEPKH